MFKVFYTEMMKLKKTWILWLVPIGALLPSFMSYTYALGLKTPTAKDMFFRYGMLLSIIIAPALFTLMTGYLVAREYQEKTINQLFSYPVSRIKFLAAKLLIMILIIAVIIALSFLLLIGFTLLMHLPISNRLLKSGIKMNIMVFLLSLGVIPVGAAVSMVGKNVIPSMVLGVVAVVVNADFMKKTWGIIFPWLTPYWAVQSLNPGLHSYSNHYFATALIILTLTFIVSLFFCMTHYASADVHSGS